MLETFSESEIDGVVVLSLTGEHDIATMPYLADRFEALHSGASDVVVDLSQTTFLDSSVLRVLLRRSEEAEHSGRGFALFLPPDGPPTSVRRVVELTRLDEALPIVSTLEEGLAMVTQRP
jgi:anti-sigma B factor antagonist